MLYAAFFHSSFILGSIFQIWAVLDVANTNKNAQTEFVDSLYEEGGRRGLKIDYPAAYASCDGRRPREVEAAFRGLAARVEKEKGRRAQLVMVFLARKGDDAYGLVKLIGDNEIGWTIKELAF